jgi:predicted CoA-binding protein
LANTLDAIANVDATDIDQWKSVAVYKIVDADDIKIIPVEPATVSVNR